MPKLNLACVGTCVSYCMALMDRPGCSIYCISINFILASSLLHPPENYKKICKNILLEQESSQNSVLLNNGTAKDLTWANEAFFYFNGRPICKNIKALAKDFQIALFQMRFPNLHNLFINFWAADLGINLFQWISLQ